MKHVLQKSLFVQICDSPQHVFKRWFHDQSFYELCFAQSKYKKSFSPIQNRPEVRNVEVKNRGGGVEDIITFFIINFEKP